MATKERRTEVHSISLINKITKLTMLEGIEIKELLTSFFHNMQVDRSENIGGKFRISKNDLTYFFEGKDVEVDNEIINVKFTYLITNRKINIVDTNTLQKTGEKEKSEGDEEKQHITIKIFPESNQAILVIEKIAGAITVSSIKDELNRYLNSHFSIDLAPTNTYVEIKPTPSESFLEDLLNTKKISLVKLTVDRKKVTNDIDEIFSGENENVRKSVDMIYRPQYKNTIKRSQVKKLYEKFSSSNGRILRIVVEGSGENGKIKLDTQGAKMAKYIKTALDIDGLIDTKDIFKNFKLFINDIPKELIGVYIDEVAATCEE